jgi:uncharacterized protein YhjY with autotransporter beta-barrel domain
MDSLKAKIMHILHLDSQMNTVYDFVSVVSICGPFDLINWVYYKGNEYTEKNILTCLPLEDSDSEDSKL